MPDRHDDVDSDGAQAPFDRQHGISDLPAFFPIPSQTSDADKLCLLGAMRLVRGGGSYSFLEIGSFRGGSLTPFLMDPACAAILSVDDRGRVQPDERGISFDYSGITTQTMLDELHRCKLRTDKLATFDGSISGLGLDHTAAFDLAFIDGEHTDEACFRDFLWTMPLMKTDGIVLFHDSSLVYKSLKLIMLYLDKAGLSYRFFKRAGSEMSGLLLGKYGDVERVGYLGEEEGAAAFFAQSEAMRIKSQFRNRARIRFAPQQLLKLRIPITVDIEDPRKRSAL